MRILFILSVILTTAFSANSFALAGVQPRTVMAPQETASVAAMRALLTRCMPGIIGGESPRMTGFSPATRPVAAAVLQGRDGRVWLDRSERVLVASYQDAPVCKVIALTVDPAVLGDIVIRVFREADTPFERQRFRMDADGGFAAVYTGKGTARSIVVRIHTARRGDGSRFATLSVEEDLPATD